MTRRRMLPLHEGWTRFSVAYLVAALGAMFVVMPFVDQLRWGRLVESVFFTIVLLTAVSAVGGRRSTLLFAALLMMPPLLARWLNHISPGLVPLEASLVAAFIFVAFVIAHLIRFVMTSSEVNSEVLCAAISVYLLFAVAWSILYSLLAVFDPDAFAFASHHAEQKMQGFTAVYFSIEVLTTIAFGDILPVSDVARMLALVESTTGIFYMTILIARLVGLYSKKPR